MQYAEDFTGGVAEYAVVHACPNLVRRAGAVRLPMDGSQFAGSSGEANVSVKRVFKGTSTSPSGMRAGVAESGAGGTSDLGVPTFSWLCIGTVEVLGA